MAIQEWGENGSELLAVDAFLMGCTDKRSAQSALDRDPKTVDDAISLMRRFYGHEKALSVERRMRDPGAGGRGPSCPASEQSPGGEVRLIRCWRIE